jgi:putative transposase
MQQHVPKQQLSDVQIPIAQCRAPAKSLAEIEENVASRNDAIKAAHVTGAYSYQQIAAHFGIHFTTVGPVVRE